jgi:hypothetical protein
MTRPDRDYDDILSRVLHSTLDPVEPAGDGLAKIQERIAEPWLKRRMSLLRTELAALGWLILVRCEPFFGRARSGLSAFATSTGRPLGTARPAPGGAAARVSSGRHQGAASRGWPGDAGLRRWLGPTMSWLRPALAVGGAVVLIVVGVFALGQFRGAVITQTNRSSNSHGSSHSHPPKHRTSSETTGSRRAPGDHGQAGQSSSHKAPGKGGSKGTPGGSSATSAPSSASPSASPSVSASPSASPSPSMSPSPTASPTTSSEGGGTSPDPSANTG